MFSPVVGENRIVHEWFRFRGTPKEEGVSYLCFFCHSTNNRTAHSCTSCYQRYGLEVTREFSVPAVANVPFGPAVNIGDKNFELRTEQITMVQASPFYGLPSEDANAHLAHFLELCDIIIIKDVTPEAIRLCLFPFSLVGKAKLWFYKDKEAVNT
jgi:hypothetical protein